VLRVRRVDFFARVGAFEMKILCVREIYEERKRRGKKTKQNKTKKSSPDAKEGRLRLCDHDFFLVCATNNDLKLENAKQRTQYTATTTATIIATICAVLTVVRVSIL